MKHNLIICGDNFKVYSSEMGQEKKQKVGVKCSTNSQYLRNLDANTKLNVLIINRERKKNNQQIRRVQTHVIHEKMLFSWSHLLKSADFWSDIILRLLLGVTGIVIENTVLPHERKIVDFTPYRYPMTKPYVPNGVLWTYVIGVPLLVIGTMYVFRRNLTDLWQSFLSFSLALAACAFITNSIKVIVGRPRPDFLDRCGYKSTLPDISNFICNGDPKAMDQARRSFPSGHSAFSFVSLSFVALYLAGQLHTFDVSKKRQTWKFFLFFIFPMSAFFVALSRVADYHHHWEDVTVGSLIGLGIAYACYRFYYPSLDSPMCHKAHADISSEDKRGAKKESYLV